MPKPHINQLKDLMDDTSPENVGQLATVIALREVTSALERVVERQDRSEVKLNEISEVLHNMDKRVTKVEDADSLPTVRKNTDRIEKLEKDLSTWQTRIYTVATVATIFWVVLGGTVENFLARVF